MTQQFYEFSAPVFNFKTSQYQSQPCIESHVLQKWSGDAEDIQKR